MREFSGFPSKTKYTPIPNVFFSELLPQIKDIIELKVTLHIFWLITLKRGYPRFITLEELAADSVLLSGLGDSGSSLETLKRGLEYAIDRGSLLRMELEREGMNHELYFINSEHNRTAIDRIQSGIIQLGELITIEPFTIPPKRPNIFDLYEQNIGLLSPIITEELKEAEKRYPAQWLEDAFKEAVDLNRRNWRYISRILERWAAEGKGDGKSGRYIKAESDPEEYYRRYGHLLKK